MFLESAKLFEQSNVFQLQPFWAISGWYLWWRHVWSPKTWHFQKSGRCSKLHQRNAQRGWLVGCRFVSFWLLKLNLKQSKSIPPKNFSLFDELADNQVPTGMDQTIIVFMGRLNDQDVKAADHYAEQIKRFAYLSLIGVQDSVTLKNLNKLADYSYTFNVQNPPANIQDVIRQAHGCNAWNDVCECFEDK